MSHPTIHPPEPLPGTDQGWLLDPSVVFLNHGSFGSLPVAVAEAAERHRRFIEAQPIARLGRGAADLLRAPKEALGRMIGAPPERIGLVENATAGIASVLRNIAWQPGDEVVTTGHVYGAVRQALFRERDLHGITLREVPVPLPIRSSDDIVARVAAALTTRTRLVLVDHITSPTALVLPVKLIVKACHEHGIAVMIDGAHAPGMVPFNLDELGADWYTGNLHKWVYAPKGCAFLYASSKRAGETHPASISHHYGAGMDQEFGWQGTRDVGAWMAITDAIAWVDAFGARAVIEHNRQLAAWAHQRMVDSGCFEPISPMDGSMRGSMAACRLDARWRTRFESVEALQAALLSEGSVEVPCMELHGDWLLRVSAAPHNRPWQYERLIDTMRALDRRA
ncbi:MAG: aminotransferase class V-fold PLP-dependent enzyme [Phycisphaerae bacterium]|nr:aminotransferase class V-fold PLP-dependent enzyme [Phycisphaerae bacterium]